MSKLIGHMVGRNEADRYLVPVLNRLATFVDEIVFVDDASEDNTYQIAQRFGANVYHVDSSLGPNWERSEGAFREFAWQKCLESHAKIGDWILAIDCDELLYGIEHLPDLMRNPNYDVLGITFYHMWTPTQYRVDKAWKPTLSSRLFKYFPGGHYRQRDLACGAEPTYVQDLIQAGRFNAHTGLRMKHLGYEDDAAKKAKYDRYMRLDNGQYHAIQHLESILDPHPELVEWKDD